MPEKKISPGLKIPLSRISVACRGIGTENNRKGIFNRCQKTLSKSCLPHLKDNEKFDSCIQKSFSEFNKQLKGELNGNT